MAVAELEFLFQVNPDIPRGKVAVRPVQHGKFHVMANRHLTDAQITMAIARFIASHDPETHPGSDLSLLP